jgi:SAM-dependent methyltransferase
MDIYLHDEFIHNLETPREVVPTLVKMFRPASVLDVGCGIGTWLKVFEEQGVKDIVGIDGDHVNRKLLKILPDNFLVRDLTKPWDLGRKFDLLISLEVAEHLPESCSDLFIEALVKHADVILFSAAIPGQGGQNHLNEQWPTFWQQKFLKHGYYVHDTIRPLFWNNDNIQWWYRQNIFLVNRQPGDPGLLNIVHPVLFSERTRDLELIERGEIGIERALHILSKTLRKFIEKKIGSR